MTTPPPAAVPFPDRLADPAGFLPGVAGGDPLAAYWLAQVTLRLRREVCWLWRERAQQGAGDASGALPPPVDRALPSLDLLRYEHERQAFQRDDATARHLGERIAALPPAASDDPPRGSFGWVARTLALEPVECFVLAVALLPAVDSAAGPVIASCLNEPARTAPTLGLAQRLWDAPDALVRCFDPAHSLLRHGLLAWAPAGIVDWQAPLAVPPLVARELLFPGGPLPGALEAICAGPLPAALDPAAIARAAATVRQQTRGMRLLPIIGAADAPLAEVAAACAREAGVHAVQPSAALPPEQLPQALAAAWLRGHAVYLPAATLSTLPMEHGGPEGMLRPPPLPGLPLAVFVGAASRGALRGLGTTLPALVVPPLSYPERLAAWRQALPDGDAMLPELARRFRYERSAIGRVGAELANLGRPPEPAEMLAAARADLDLGTLAQPVLPRFRLADLMLPAPQARQVEEIIAAMRALTRVHYDWGTARAWNEAGLAALFAGPPGTGKTMAAEAIAAELALPLYRIDLSQVVDKYIGETEKNLRRLFDAADAADVILFFDEADALFGKRTEVRDAHDRYANLEISYLLERMERFKGMALLATNRKKDVDEAFLRRLRFVVEFPLPEAPVRERIWRGVIPPNVDASGLDFPFLAERFPLAGGHIRAIVFQACLQSAGAQYAQCGVPRLGMDAVVLAVQREYEKLDRANSLNQFGPYAALVAAQRSVR
ncbi:ATP-binding protein [Massilia sp. METH4]|uniref:AAA family ATPase n=1 Tax=Massilia sp. METH4 TaxID=3123041 RepID=UPI0030D42648